MLARDRLPVDGHAHGHSDTDAALISRRLSIQGLNGKMEPPARHEHTRATLRSTQASFTTAPASPDRQDMSPYTTMAHVAFAPATQQTVVTTTTTTTVTLPPLLIRPPRDMLSRDPKQYPLASTSTPSSLQRFSLNVRGVPIVYQEAQNVQSSLEEVL